VLIPLGPWGVLLGSFIDSASIPIPIDVLMAMFAWSDKQHFYVYALLAALGSSLGGLIPFFVGRAGGELFLLKRVDRVRFDSMRKQFEKQEFLAVMVPSLLPPPTPWKLFVFGAGVFEMRTLLFVLAVFVGRTIRFGVEMALVVKYGPQIIKVMTDVAKRHMALTLVVLALVFVGLGWWMWKKMRGKGPVSGAV
jgi:membrane protein YqaA with SNARE-associated domain